MSRLKAGISTPSISTPRFGAQFAAQDQVLRWAPIVESASRTYKDIPAGILLGLIDVESSGDPDAVSSAGAFGLTQFIQSTANKYGVSRDNPRSQIFGAAHYLTDLMNGVNPDRRKIDLHRALNWYNGAQIIKTASGDKPNPYADNVINAAKKYGKPLKLPSDPITSELGKLVSGAEKTLTAPLHWTELFAKFLAKLLSPTGIAELASDAFAWFIRLIWKALYKYVILPPWHATQRAVNYYMTVEMNDGTKVLVTISFWATGWAILFGKIDAKREGRTFFGVSPFAKAHETPLGRTVQTGINTVKRGKLIKPKDVEDSTLTQPEPTISEVPITQTRAVSATRRRAVRVTESSSTGASRTYRVSAPGEDKDAIE